MMMPMNRIGPNKGEAKLPDTDWDAALRNLEASDWPEPMKAYYRRVWAFLRDKKAYSRPIRPSKVAGY